METGPLVTQGSVEGAVLSAVNLDNGVKEYFHDEEDKDDKDNEKENEKDSDVTEKTDNNGEEDVMYGQIKIKPLLFQDDIWNASKSLESAQLANIKMEKLMESKLLDLHQDKSCYIVAGAKKAREKIRKEIVKKPLLLYNGNMKEVVNNKYLGCLLGPTVGQSITDTINSRI